MDSQPSSPKNVTYTNKITFADNKDDSSKKPKTLLLSDKTFHLLKDKSKTIRTLLEDCRLERITISKKDGTLETITNLTLNTLHRNVFIGLLPWIKKDAPMTNSTATEHFSDEDLIRAIELLKASNYLELQSQPNLTELVTTMIKQKSTSIDTLPVEHIATIPVDLQKTIAQTILKEIPTKSDAFIPLNKKTLPDSITSITFSPDDEQIAVAAYNGTITILKNNSTLETQQTIPLPCSILEKILIPLNLLDHARIHALAYHPSKHYLLAATDKGLYIWDKEFRTSRTILTTPTQSVLFDKQGTGYAAGEDVLVKLSFGDSLIPSIKIFPLHGKHTIYNLALDDSGTLLAAVNNKSSEKTKWLTPYHTISVWDTQKLEMLHTIQTQSHSFFYAIQLKKNDTKITLMAKSDDSFSQSVIENNTLKTDNKQAYWGWKKIKKPLYLYIPKFTHKVSIKFKKHNLKIGNFVPSVDMASSNHRSQIALHAVGSQDLLVSPNIKPLFLQKLLRVEENKPHLIVPSLVAYGLIMDKLNPSILSKKYTQEWSQNLSNLYKEEINGSKIADQRNH
jgi:hypothetical protein